MRDPIRSARLGIYDMLDHIQFAREAAAHLTLEQFREQRLNRLATERSIGIISEASRQIGKDLKATAPAIPWPRIAGIGNVLRHDYRAVAPEVIWNAVQNDLAALETAARDPGPYRRVMIA